MTPWVTLAAPSLLHLNNGKSRTGVISKVPACSGHPLSGRIAPEHGWRCERDCLPYDGITHAILGPLARKRNGVRGN